MAYAVISDVHSNLEAIRTVFEDLKRKKIKDVFSLGDSVGYGAEPNECIELLKTECKVILAGNHDWGVCGLTDIAFFNEYARAAIEWTRDVITEENIAELRSFPVKSEPKEKNITLVHSTPYQPEQWHYLFRLSDAEFNFRHFDTDICFIGHSHQPVIIEKTPSGELVAYKNTASVRYGSRYIINVGSVGQPRDGDPRACYAVVDEGKVEIARIRYDIEAAQTKMLEAGLPLPLIERLSSGV
ncbi:MAG: metallophosphoesterase family protein [Nitrospirota bacterium]